MVMCPSCGTENPEGFNFCGRCAAPLDSTPVREVRKTVTALFCDLVGSTTLGERHDPEVLRPLLHDYFEQMRSAIERHGGEVEKFIGDAVAAVFGLPAAHEDDALRAVRAGLEMQERLLALNEGSAIALNARIGITTGEVLVPADGTPIGDAMNTASRLQSSAAPGEVWVGEPTWRLVRDAVVAELVEPVHAKGKAEPVPAFRVLRVQPVATRAETPLVGRDRHLAMLGEALRDAIEARAPVLVTILAPPGVGKSRLAAEFRRRLGNSRRSSSGRPPPTATASRSHPWSSCCPMRRDVPGERPRRSPRGSVNGWSVNRTPPRWAIASRRSLASVRRSRPRRPGRSGACSRWSPPSGPS